MFHLLEMVLPVMAQLIDTGAQYGCAPMVMLHHNLLVHVHVGWSPFHVRLVELWNSPVVHMVLPLLNSKWANKDVDVIEMLDDEMCKQVACHFAMVLAPTWDVIKTMKLLIAVDAPAANVLCKTWRDVVHWHYPMLLAKGHDADDNDDVKLEFVDAVTDQDPLPQAGTTATGQDCHCQCKSYAC
ncbi:hypothetical protein AMAG_17586 [Allomyces macrogynus ATCC 38327]|uniref:Uncharacterized protein n=1 Tax=Allomyces macrogynus (strain ATCC 38327) TaxID=578462 RepID=A0A0L0TFA9_ALLM3|nr:hypothetical protein AMAG_17586 [Allomyces macrogynus ATCC 38327]|eukprot:KNE73390.1 hypothetical protein AMAG_17586 [Allomyces macrogynus ATCC 38327]